MSTKLYCDSEFCEDRCSDSHTLLKGVNELIFVLHALLADLSEIRFKRSAHQVTDHLRVSWKQAWEDRIFFMGLNKITFTHVPYFESKERLGNTCVLRHEVHHLHSVQPSTTCSQPFVSLSESHTWSTSSNFTYHYVGMWVSIQQ